MNHVFAKIRSRENIFEKLYSGDPIYELPTELQVAVEYNPETILEEDDWYKIDQFSSTEYAIEVLKKDFNTVEYDEANRVRTESVEYIMSVQDNVYYFQRILKHSIMKKKRITLGDTIRLDQGEKSIVINSTPDAIYVKDDDILYFKKLSTISPIFKGIDELYREATEEETKEFLQNDFIELEDGYGVEKVKKSNRKRIAMAMDTLSSFSPRDKQKMLKYIHEYYPALKYEEKKKLFTIGSEEEMKFLLWGIDQRFYTTPVTNERRVANSIMQLE